LIDEIVREGARRMLAEALRAEVDAYVAGFAGERDEHGRRLVVRNGYHEPREVLTSAGAIEVTAPRVNDKRTDPDTGGRKRFRSVILPPWARKPPKITDVLPLLYLELGQLLGQQHLPDLRRGSIREWDPRRHRHNQQPSSQPRQRQPPPHRHQPRSPVSTYADANASAASSTSTGMPHDLHG
jgi:hypothetical protein